MKERNRISREIHDSVGHSLSTTIIQLNAIEKLLKDKPLISDLVHELREFVTESFQDVRRAISELKPIEYENYQNLLKIRELVNSFIKLTNINVRLTISKIPGTYLQINLSLYIDLFRNLFPTHQDMEKQLKSEFL